MGAVFFAALLAVASCGKKAPPKPPKEPLSVMGRGREARPMSANGAKGAA